jgi:ElaB/YqjD/DUF883 family membrane-anchored ribosome-binding protein
MQSANSSKFFTFEGMTMESNVAGNFARTSQALADKAADKVQAGIRRAQESAKDAGDSLSGQVSDVHDKAVPMIRTASGRAQSTVQQSLDAINDIAGQARDAAANAADSIVSYTKKNPMTALAIAAASGVVLYAAIRALRSSRD